jgi:hypothetical protein
VLVKATAGLTAASTKSDPLGFFNLTLNPEVGQTVLLTFQHPNYETLEIAATTPGNQLYIARMRPVQPETGSNANNSGMPGKFFAVTNVRVRYTSKEQSVVGVGSLAKQFPVPNIGNVPCRRQEPCSPDGRWKATTTTLPLDAGEGDEFRNVRVTCIAGPCAFTKIESDRLGQPARRITISVVNWSDSADFLVEADVARTMMTDAVQYSYPFKVGQTINFSLPPSSEGASIEADLDGQYIVFPLGPEVILSLASCTVEVSKDGNKTYRCELKPGYLLQ